ncbi:MAG: hypothetical protein LC792_09915, partial [Actinobacteria bacterium]|nr:hypothetical protein [Actinomycetota bacterium]
MISWATILYGAALTAVITAVTLLILGERRAGIVAVGSLSALLAPIAWNAILRATHAHEFFTDAPLAVMPASWQDAGSGVFTLGLSCLALAAIAPREPLRRGVLRTALVCALVAFLVDVYLY